MERGNRPHALPYLGVHRGQFFRDGVLVLLEMRVGPSRLHHFAADFSSVGLDGFHFLLLAAFLGVLQRRRVLLANVGHGAAHFVGDDLPHRVGAVPALLAVGGDQIGLGVGIVTSRTSRWCGAKPPEQFLSERRRVGAHLLEQCDSGSHVLGRRVRREPVLLQYLSLGLLPGVSERGFVPVEWNRSSGLPGTWLGCRASGRRGDWCRGCSG